MTDIINKPVLRIIYFEIFDLNIFDIIEDALLQAKFNVKQFGGGAHVSKKRNEMIKGYSDYYIDKYENFDLEFCRDVISTVLPYEFELEIYEDDPFLNVTP